MTPRQAVLDCLDRGPSGVFEAALWISVEHDATVQPAQVMEIMGDIQVKVSASLPMLPVNELGQPLLRQINALGFQQDDDFPLQARAALLDKVIRRRRGQPLALALITLELARRLNIPLIGVNFPGHFLLRIPGADHQLDPCGGRRLYPADCRELLSRQFGVQMPLAAEHLREASPRQMLQRLSRNLRQLNIGQNDDVAALKDAERVLQLGHVNASDHMARAGMYQRLDCPGAERFDLEHALLLTEDPIQQLLLTTRLSQLLPATSKVH